jgi:hypothetical protein
VVPVDRERRRPGDRGTRVGIATLPSALLPSIDGESSMPDDESTASSIGRCTVPVMMTGAVNQHRPMELAVLREERDLLKRATAFFAKETR